jgi:hypothetical protein
MSHRIRPLLALALASTLGLGMTLTAHALDFEGAGLTLSAGGSYSGGATINSGARFFGGSSISSVIWSTSFTLAGDNKGESLTFNLGLPTIGTLPPSLGGSGSTIINSGIPVLTGGGVPPEVVPTVPPLQSNAVPEPSAVLLAVVAALGFVGLHRRSKLAAR